MKKSWWLILVSIAIICVIGFYYLKPNYVCYGCAEDPCGMYRNITQEAANLSNINLCFSIDKNSCQIGCVMQVSNVVKNPTICFSIENETYRDYCLISILSCENISSIKNKDSCYYVLSIKQSNFSVCSSIQETKTKDNCYYGLGISKGDNSICNPIQNESWKQECIELAKNPSGSLIHSR